MGNSVPHLYPIGSADVSLFDGSAWRFSVSSGYVMQHQKIRRIKEKSEKARISCVFSNGRSLCFGTKRSWVQIPSPRPIKETIQRMVSFIAFLEKTGFEAALRKSRSAAFLAARVKSRRPDQEKGSSFRMVLFLITKGAMGFEAQLKKATVWPFCWAWAANPVAPNLPRLDSAPFFRYNRVKE